MKDRLQAGMAEITRLTRTGRLKEATSAIQHALGIGTANKSTEQPDSAEAPIEAEFRVIDDSPPSTETATGNMAYTGTLNGPAAMPGIRTPDDKFGTTRPRPARSGLKTDPVRPGGQFVDASYSNAAGTRSYKLYIPRSYTGQAVSLVVMLHGCSQTAVDFAAGTGMNVLAEEKTFLVAYPEQASSANSSRCWNWFQTADQQHGTGEPSLIAGITQQIMHAYSVDAKRVYVAGISAGAAMAAILAVTYPDLYAAVGMHSGLPYGAAHDMPSAFMAMTRGAQPARPPASVIPLILFHGDRDTTVAPVNSDTLLNQWLHASNGGSSTGRRAAPDPAVERGQVPNGHTYTRFIYSDANGRPFIEKWMIHQEGHAWSGGNSQGSYTDPKGPDASVEMVRFFAEHARK